MALAANAVAARAGASDGLTVWLLAVNASASRRQIDNDFHVFGASAFSGVPILVRPKAMRVRRRPSFSAG